MLPTAIALFLAGLLPSISAQGQPQEQGQFVIFNDCNDTVTFTRYFVDGTSETGSLAPRLNGIQVSWSESILRADLLSYAFRRNAQPANPTDPDAPALGFTFLTDFSNGISGTVYFRPWRTNGRSNHLPLPAHGASQGLVTASAGSLPAISASNLISSATLSSQASPSQSLSTPVSSNLTSTTISQATSSASSSQVPANQTPSSAIVTSSGTQPSPIPPSSTTSSTGPITKRQASSTSNVPSGNNVIDKFLVFPTDSRCTGARTSDINLRVKACDVGVINLYLCSIPEVAR